MNVLVIGGNGLFGRKTVLKLLQDANISKVVSIDVIPPKEWILPRYREYDEKFNYVRKEKLKEEADFSERPARAVGR